MYRLSGGKERRIIEVHAVHDRPGHSSSLWPRSAWHRRELALLRACCPASYTFCGPVPPASPGIGFVPHFAPVSALAPPTRARIGFVLHICPRPHLVGCAPRTAHLGTPTKIGLVFCGRICGQYTIIPCPSSTCHHLPSAPIGFVWCRRPSWVAPLGRNWLCLYHPLLLLDT